MSNYGYSHLDDKDEKGGKSSNKTYEVLSPITFS